MAPAAGWLTAVMSGTLGHAFSLPNQPRISMRVGLALGLVAAMALFFGAFAALGDFPWSGALMGTLVAAGGAALGLGLRRLIDRSTARSLSRGGPSGSESAAFQVSSYRPYRSWSVIGTVTTTAAYEGKRFMLHDAKHRLGRRLVKRLGFGRRLAGLDEEFNRDVYVDHSPEVGAKLFASAESRAAARAIFDMEFFAIEYRHGLVMAFRHGKVADHVAAAARPHLLVLAANSGAVSHESGHA